MLPDVQIQQKLQKGKFSDAENKKQLRLTISTSNFVLLIGYTGVVRTAADKVGPHKHPTSSYFEESNIGLKSEHIKMQA